MSVLAEPMQANPVFLTTGAPLDVRVSAAEEVPPEAVPGDDAEDGGQPPATRESHPIGDGPIASSDPFDDFEDDDFDDEFDDDFEEEWDDDPEDDGFGPEFQDDEGDEFDVDADGDDDDDKKEGKGGAFKDDADFDD